MPVNTNTGVKAVNAVTAEAAPPAWTLLDATFRDTFTGGTPPVTVPANTEEAQLVSNG